MMQARPLTDTDLVLLRERRRRAGVPVSTPPDPLTWALAARLIDDAPFSLDRHAPLRQLYADQSRRIVVTKPAQVGVSEWAISRTCWTLAHGATYWQTGLSGLNVAYVFPTGEALGDFSKERLSGLQWRDGQSLFTAYDDVTFKQAGQSYLYLRSARSESALLSFRADVLILDEYDRMDPKAIHLARKRLRASPVRREIDISTPTVPGIGIHAEYLASDQQVWEVQCGTCRAWHELDFFRDVHVAGASYAVWKHWQIGQIQDVTVACPTCHRAIDPCGPGRWIARQPDVALRGYQIPALSFPTIDLAELVTNALSDDPTVITEFYRSDLGLPYEPAGSRVTDVMLAQLDTDVSAGPWRQTTMGVDVGSRYHYRIDSTGPDGMRAIRAMGSVRQWSDLDALMQTYAVRLCVVDAMPEQHGAQDWAHKHRGKVLRALYPEGITELFRVDEHDGEIRINRTMAMDGVYAAIAGATEHWPAAVVHDPEVRAHLQAPVRVEFIDRHGQLRAQWVHTRPDHGFHASVYAMVAYAALPVPLPSVLSQSSAKGWSPR